LITSQTNKASVCGEGKKEVAVAAAAGRGRRTRKGGREGGRASLSFVLTQINN
jgi:hypothetical protein